MSRNTTARIDLSALQHNFATVRRLAPDSRVASVVKADGYGHGIQRIARALPDSDLLAVATLGEAQSVRDSGWRGRLLLLEGYTGRNEFMWARKLDADFVLHHPSQLEILEANGCCSRQHVWLKLDTGMHRLGFPAREAASLLQRIARISGVHEPVLMTHFACADDTDNDMTREQAALFDQETQSLPGQRSLANSAAVLNFPETCRDIVRPGVMLYGISPIPGRVGSDHGLQPVMTLECQLLAVNACRAGDRVGYGATWVCPEDMLIGVAGIGYGDGYPRHLRSGAPVLVNGQPARLAGRVSMDLITLDLRGLDKAEVGDPVVLWGAGLPVETVAEWAGAIPYELICGVTGRVRRKSV